MRKPLLILIGFIPLAAGLAINWLINIFPTKNLPFGIISIGFLVFWVWLGFISCKFKETIKVSVCLVHLPLFLALVFNLYQEIVLEHYLSNIIGLYAQIFYLPIINIAYKLTIWSTRLWTAYVGGFFLMCFSYFSGYLLKKHQRIKA